MENKINYGSLFNRFRDLGYQPDVDYTSWTNSLDSFIARVFGMNWGDFSNVYHEDPDVIRKAEMIMGPHGRTIIKMMLLANKEKKKHAVKDISA